MSFGGGFSFGANTTAPNAVTSTTISTGFSFGAQPSQTSIATTTVTPSFGGPLLSTKSSTTTSGLGGSFFSTPTANATLGFGPKSSTGLTTAANSSGFSLGGPSATLAFGSGSTPASSIGTFGVAPTSNAIGTFNPSSTTPAAPKTVGLGGVDFTSSNNSGKNGIEAGNKNDEKALKATDVPNEIASTVESFKKHVKNQKVISEEICRVSSKPLLKVGEETVSLKQLVSVVSNGIHRNTNVVAKLKLESARELKNAEIAKQTKDMPAGMQYENTAPTEYFQRMVVEFEHRMLSYKQQIEELEHHLLALNHSTPVNPNELASIVKKIHETFVVLAAQLYSVNEGIRAQKDQFLHYRKTAFGDSKDIFVERFKLSSKEVDLSDRAAERPSAFTHIPNAAAIAMVTALNRNQQTPGLTNAGLGGGLPTATTNPSLFGAAQNSLLFPQNTALGGSTVTPAFNFGNSQLNSSMIRPAGFGASTAAPGTAVVAAATAQPKPGFGFGQSTSGFGSSFSFGNTSAVKPLGK